MASRESPPEIPHSAPALPAAPHNKLVRSSPLAGGMNVLAAAAELIESDAAFALRIQTSEPVLVSIAKAHGHGAMSAVGMQLLRDRHDWSPTEVSAVVLAPYIFGTLGLHEEPPDPWKGRRLTPERGVPLAVSTVG